MAVLPLTNKLIASAMAAVATTVFPHRALEVQRLWMTRSMKKQYDLSTQKTAAAITQINNCLPLFPGGLPTSKFSDAEVVGLLEWSLPQLWRDKFDLKGYTPALDDKAKLIAECKAIEQHEIEYKQRKDVESSDNKKSKKQVCKKQKS